MSSSTFTQSSTSTWNSESSSIGSCSDTKVVGCRISNLDVHAQANRSGAEGPPSLTITEKELEVVHENHTAVKGLQTHNQGLRGCEDRRRTGQGAGGSVWLESNFVENVGRRGSKNQEVYRLNTFFSSELASFYGIYHVLVLCSAAWGSGEETVHRNLVVFWWDHLETPNWHFLGRVSWYRVIRFLSVNPVSNLRHLARGRRCRVSVHWVQRLSHC